MFRFDYENPDLEIPFVFIGLYFTPLVMDSKGSNLINNAQMKKKIRIFSGAFAIDWRHSMLFKYFCTS